MWSWNAALRFALSGALDPVGEVDSPLGNLGIPVATEVFECTARRIFGPFEQYEVS